jgi:hypothetical protein
MSYQKNLRYALMNGGAIRMRGQGIVIPPTLIGSSNVTYPVSTITGTIRDRPLSDRAETGSKSNKKSSKKSSKKKGSFKSLKFNF